MNCGRHCLIAQSMIFWSNFCHSSTRRQMCLDVIDVTTACAIHQLLQYAPHCAGAYSMIDWENSVMLCFVIGHIAISGCPSMSHLFVDTIFSLAWSKTAYRARITVILICQIYSAVWICDYDYVLQMMTYYYFRFWPPSWKCTTTVLYTPA